MSFQPADLPTDFSLTCFHSCVSLFYKISACQTSPAVQWLRLSLPMQGAWVWLLVGEWGFHMLWGAAKNLKKKKERKEAYKRLKKHSAFPSLSSCFCPVASLPFLSLSLHTHTHTRTHARTHAHTHTRTHTHRVSSYLIVFSWGNLTNIAYWLLVVWGGEMETWMWWENTNK